MAYLSNKNKGKNVQENISSNPSSQSMQKKPLYNNGYNVANNYKNGIETNGDLQARLNAAKQKQKKEAAKKAIHTAASTYGPVAGAAADAAMKTKKGEKYLDAYSKADTEAEGIRNVKKEIKKDTRKITITATLIAVIAPVIIILLLLVAAKNADSQIYSNKNGGTIQSEDYIGDDKVVNIFANYPGLYEKIIDKANKVGDKYQVEIDKYLIIATLVAPISNELIVPIEDNSCGEERCYYFKGESVTWKKFLSSWADQAELLAKMQLLTYINNENEIKVNCGKDETMEQYAQNDLETNEFPWYGWLNPVNWFKGFRDAAGAEVNAKCVSAHNGETKVPTVRVLSIDQGTYYLSNDSEWGFDFVKDENSGGVYFWNLVNKNGFIHEYLKDYLSADYKDDPDKNYEINKKTIVETVNYIYAYYESIRKDCNGYPVIKGELEKVNFREDPNSTIYSLDFEDIFVGGSVLATYGGATGEVAYAQAIITRSEAYNYIIEQGQSIITGTAKMGCWWWKYNPTYDPSYENQEDNPNYDPDYPKEHFPEIYKAVTETRGIVVTNYNDIKVLETEYDAFCPTTREAKNGFYYLPDGQRNLPIEVSKFRVPKNRVECPCFQNGGSQPGTQYSDTLDNLLNKKVGTPAQTTTATCWDPTGSSKTDEDGNVLYGYKYHATGGHGRGVSQHGMAYFSQFGYDHEAIIKLFMERDGKGVSFKRYEGSIEEGECPNHGYYNRESLKGTGYSSNSNGEFNEEYNHMDVIGGERIRKTIGQAVATTGHTIGDLNSCIGDKVTEAGMGTREGVVEAGYNLLKCTMDMTGGYTYPYDHQGGRVDGGRNPDINGKLGINSAWGGAGSGLNCATSVRWALCNGGFNHCTGGSTYAIDYYSSKFLPGAIRIDLYPTFRVWEGSTDISSSEEAFDAIKPGDLLFSDNLSGGADHIMLIVGKTDDAINIAENGRGTRNISKSELLGSSQKMYGVVLLDDYYANPDNQNSLSW